MKFLLLVLVLFAATVGTIACRKAGSPLVEGGLYSFPLEQGGHGVLKILKLDEGGIHVRVYANRFEAPPSDVQERELRLESADGEDQGVRPIGHLPISREGFASWKAKFIKKVAVSEDELEGYGIWKEAGGGYF